MPGDGLLPLSALHDLTGKVAFVTGSASGIGRATARRLAEAGARVCGFDLNEEGAEATAAALGGKERAMACVGDVRNRADLEAAATGAVGRWGRLDLLVNSAGLFPPAPLMEMPLEAWDHVVGVNATGTFLASQVCAAVMAETSGRGAIVNVASKSSLQPTRGFGHYAASKGAVAMMTKAFALELAPHIRVNAIAPGSVATEGARQASAALTGSYADPAPDGAGEADARYARCPLGRSATADEIATMIVVLASDWSSFMTGSVVLVDGGFLLS